MAVQRRKEIGIRKVLGASIPSIVRIMSSEFTILIGVAFLIAGPIAWYLMHQWLQQYTYRISMGAGFFIMTLVTSIIIAWLTVGYTAYADIKTFGPGVVDIPNAFTPNDDGRNDIFYIIGEKEITQLKEFIIYDRWGRTMFKTSNALANDPHFGWNGYTNGIRAEPGTLCILYRHPVCQWHRRDL